MGRVPSGVFLTSVSVLELYKEMNEFLSVFIVTKNGKNVNINKSLHVGVECGGKKYRNSEVHKQENPLPNTLHLPITYYLSPLSSPSSSAS